MIDLIDSKNIAIHGFHNKAENSYSIMEANLPLLIDEQYSPFLLTKGYQYSTSTKDIIDLLRRQKALLNYLKLKSIITNIMITPGLLLALLFIAKALNLLQLVPQLYSFSTSWVADFIFWISILGIVILWHDYFRNKTHPVKLPQNGRFTSRDLNSIKVLGIKFGFHTALKAHDFLTEDSKEIIFRASERAKLDTLKLFNELIALPEIKEIAGRANLKFNETAFFEKNVNERTFPTYPIESIRSLITYALEEAIITQDVNVKPMHIFVAMMRVYPALIKLQKEQGSNLEILRETANIVIRNEQFAQRFNGKANINKPYYRNGGVIFNTLFGYRNRFGKNVVNLSYQVALENEVYGIGREAELHEIISIIEKPDNNKVLLVGYKGTGKSSIVKGLIQMINHLETPRSLTQNTVIEFATTLIKNINSDSDLKYFKGMLKSFSNSKTIILYLDNLTELLELQLTKKLHKEAYKALIEYIMTTKQPIITTSDYGHYQNVFKDFSELFRRFEAIEVRALNQSETLELLKERLPIVEKTNGILITTPALISTIELSTKFVNNERLPASTQHLLNEIILTMKKKRLKSLTPQILPELLQNRESSQISPNYEVKPVEDTMLIQTEARIHQKLIGRSDVIHFILKEINLNASQKMAVKPTKGSFLIVGPRGSGKTYIAETLAEEVYSSKSNLVTFDLSQPTTPSEITRLIANYGTKGESDNKTITVDTLIAFENIEYAEGEILQLIESIVSEGKALDQYNRLIDVRNCLILLTSRLGSDSLLKALNNDQLLIEEAKQSVVLEIRQQISKPILDHISNIFILSPYSILELTQIAEISLTLMHKRYLKRGIQIDWERALPQYIANKVKSSSNYLHAIEELLELLESEIKSRIKASEKSDSFEALNVKLQTSMI